MLPHTLEHQERNEQTHQIAPPTDLFPRRLLIPQTPKLRLLRTQNYGGHFPSSMQIALATQAKTINEKKMERNPTSIQNLTTITPRGRTTLTVASTHTYISWWGPKRFLVRWERTRIGKHGEQRRDMQRGRQTRMSEGYSLTWRGGCGTVREGSEKVRCCLSQWARGGGRNSGRPVVGDY